MSIKYNIKKIIQGNYWIRKFVLHVSNKLKLKGNKLCSDNIHFRKNIINLSSGTEQKFFCDESSFIQHCVVNMSGSNNYVKIDSDTKIYNEDVQTFHIDGGDNQIIIGKNCVIRNTSFFIWGNHNTIKLDDNISCYGTEFHIERNHNLIHICEGSTFHGRTGYPIHIAVDEGTSILIEEDCMLSNGIQIRSTDSHSIIDKDGKRLNPAENIVIRKHCWLSFGCIILKGTHISDHTVVAAGTICTKKYFESRCVLAGNPAKVVKRDIDWNRKFL